MTHAKVLYYVNDLRRDDSDQYHDRNWLAHTHLPPSEVHHRYYKAEYPRQA